MYPDKAVKRDGTPASQDIPLAAVFFMEHTGGDTFATALTGRVTCLQLTPNVVHAQ